MTNPHPVNLFRRLSAAHEFSRRTAEKESWTDRAAWQDGWTSLADARIAHAVNIGIPIAYIDSTTGHYSVPEDICWGCWSTIDGPVVALGVNAGCRHYHPSCRDHDSALRTGVHGRPACRSSIPHYEG